VRLVSARFYRTSALALPRYLAALAVFACFTGCAVDPTPQCDEVSPEYLEDIDISLPITVEISGQTSTLPLVSHVNFGASSDGDGAGGVAWQAFRHFLIEDISQVGGGATWDVEDPTFAAPIGAIAFQLAGSFRPGDLIQVTTASGISDTLGIANGLVGPAPAGATGIEVDARTHEQWRASSVSGTVEVLGVAPLWLRVDLLAINVPGDDVRVRGEMTTVLSHRPCK